MDFLDLSEKKFNAVQKKPWMDTVKMELVTVDTLSQVIDECIEADYCALDVETTGLDDRVFDGISTQDQLAGTMENMKAIHELVEISSTIMNNLGEQKDIHEKLLVTIKNMDDSTKKMKEITRSKQEEYIDKLNNNLEQLRNYFHSVNEKLENLHKNLSKMNFIEQ